jgi:hypothetical protein
MNIKTILVASIFLVSYSSYCWWLHFENNSNSDVSATAYFSCQPNTNCPSPKPIHIGTAGSTESLFIEGCVTKISFDVSETVNSVVTKKAFDFTPTQRSGANDTCANYHVYIKKNAAGNYFAESTLP